jgi:acyl carrier protein
MDKNEIIEKLGKKICEDILKDTGRTLAPDEVLISSGLIDSFSLVDLALMAEQMFGVRIEDYELNADTFDNLEQLADIIVERKG